MFNVGGPELLVILLVALLVLGPQRLPEAAKQIGKVMGELRRVSSGFQQEMRGAMHDPVEAAARDRGSRLQPPNPDGPATAPAPPADGAAAPPAAKKTAAKKAPAKKAAPRKRATPLRAADKPDSSAAP